MSNKEIENLIRELIEKTKVDVKEISIIEESPKSTWISLEVSEPHFFIERDGEGLSALNHLVHRIMENKNPASRPASQGGKDGEPSILIDINGYQKKRVENIRAIAHMMSERARYFKSNVEVDPMSAFERRIVHEFLSEAQDLQTESIGVGRDRRVVIKYIGTI
jgi:spoIIIJ-associated protein